MSYITPSADITSTIPEGSHICAVIYLSPPEAPNCYVVRKHYVTLNRPYQPKIAAVGVVAKGLAEARKIASKDGRKNMGRAANDDPTIVEIWV